MSGCGGSCGSCSSGCGVPEGDYQIFAGVDRIPGFKVVGVSAVISCGEEEMKEVETLWEEFYKQQVGAKLEVAENDAIMAVYSDYEGDKTRSYRLTIGYEPSADSDVPEGLVSVDIKEDEYALVRAGGEQPTSRLDAWKTIKESDLERCLRTDFEVYSPKIPEEGEYEVLVVVGINISEEQ